MTCGIQTDVLGLRFWKVLIGPLEFIGLSSSYLERGGSHWEDLRESLFMSHNVNAGKGLFGVVKRELMGVSLSQKYLKSTVTQTHSLKELLGPIPVF